MVEMRKNKYYISLRLFDLAWKNTDFDKNVIGLQRTNKTLYKINR